MLSATASSRAMSPLLHSPATAPPSLASRPHLPSVHCNRQSQMRFLLGQLRTRHLATASITKQSAQRTQKLQLLRVSVHLHGSIRPIYLHAAISCSLEG